MRIPGSGKLKRIAKRVRNRIAPPGLILMYHRVTEIEFDPWKLCVSPAYFAEHLQVLQKLGCAVRLQQLNQTLKNGKRPHRQVVITFDDGYTDNLYNAKPLLEKYEIPATIFLTTGYMQQKREFWSDELERILLQPGTLPEVLSLNINGTSYEWKLDATNDSEKSNNLDLLHTNERYSLYYSLYELLYPLSAIERSHLLDQLLLWANKKPELRSTHRMMTIKELSTLQPGNIIEIGGHTVTHPFLATISPEQQLHEIQENKIQLEEIFGQTIESFAYPHGNYNSETSDLVRQAGFTCACTTNANIVGKNSDRFQLPRFAVENCNGEEFAKQLSKWFLN
ncbi:polysaccharide deacetylase [Tolypothrix sp. NIES-4075]|uniref:polysaccharide deacetylase family protein n=1 Tax=Tolypothrix sp. NIES-4075 TaxID=2005459 RepID=UPI000B5CF21A|nr:polysaccharide deacetylase family protein [Tolypothrix sp. NIES-4075]GAX41895.1 polysaccharide deacetylase [Tolypothrix sp. NIES-4075]